MFSSLLESCRPLHENGTLSLDQLVPVHASLIGVASSAKETSSKSENTSEKELLINILGNSDNDSERLLAWQYLLKSSPDSDPLSSLLIYTYKGISVSLPFVDAALSVIPSRKCSENCWKVLLEPRDVKFWHLTCRVWKFLLKSTGQSNEVFEKATESVVTALRDVQIEHVDEWLRPMALDILPILAEHENSRNKLWDLCGGIRENLLVTTTVLCLILPSVVQQPQEVLDWKTRTPAPLTQHEGLWDLIYDCLDQGLDVARRSVPAWVASVVETKNTTSGHSGLIRRRGLFLLQRICECPDLKDAHAWSLFAACLETIEMESQVHLMDQVWETISKAKNRLSLDYKWYRLWWRRSWSHEHSGTRKTSLYFAIIGKAGISLTNDGKHGVSLSQLDADLIVHLISCFDSLDSQTYLVGTKQRRAFNLKEMVADFVRQYIACAPDRQIEELVKKLWNISVHVWWYRKTTIWIWEVVADALYASRRSDLQVTAADLDRFFVGLDKLFERGGLIVAQFNSARRSLATTLACCRMPDDMVPIAFFKILSLFELPELLVGSDELDASSDGGEVSKSWMEKDDMWVHLRSWLKKADAERPTSQSIASASPAAFVNGMVTGNISEWDVVSGASLKDRQMARAIVLFVSLLTVQDGGAATASELLWPAINKGLSCAQATIDLPGWPKAGAVSRALELLRVGCELKLLSGMGNGDLIVDRQNNIMPPPPQIEEMLSHAIEFQLWHLRQLVPSCLPDGQSAESFTDGDSKFVSTTFARIVYFLQVFFKSYPSSTVVTEGLTAILSSSLDALAKEGNPEHISLLYGALTTGARIESMKLKDATRLVVNLELSTGSTRLDVRTARTMFEYSKWGVIGMLLPRLIAQESESDVIVSELCVDVFKAACDVIDILPVESYVPFFDAVTSAARFYFSLPAFLSTTAPTESLAHLSSILDALVTMMQSQFAKHHIYMLDQICAFAFSEPLLSAEASRLQKSDSVADDPVRRTYRELIKYAGTKRSHVAKAVLHRISFSWLGLNGDRGTSPGIAAIPYKDDLLELLVHRFQRLEATCTSQVLYTQPSGEGVADIPVGSDDLSVARAFALGFLDKLPSRSEGLDPVVLSDLVYPLIWGLFEKTEVERTSLFMKGTPEYCLQIRAWQALCVCTKFVTVEIAERACEKAFQAMSGNTHGQIRFFIEVFTLQCARQHPRIFCTKLVNELVRKDLTNQNVASLMILAGNLVVGRYQVDFFSRQENKKSSPLPLAQVLAGVIPWLGSTQGFTRVIAQLLVHKLIPMVVDVNQKSSGPLTDSDWYLRYLYGFLNDNVEMKRLRKKQARFFEAYDVDQACRPEGIFSFPLDDTKEANPGHLADVLKVCLRELYSGAHEQDAPEWKQVEEALSSIHHPVEGEDDGDVNFQRKIIPLDSLNLAMEDAREQKLRNAAGRRKQKLVICASLIDKVPNLGGLARTAEIFAAERLLIPDLSITKHDTFQNLCVSADDWIDIEECRETDLVNRLMKFRSQGYYIVGVEQTSGSLCLTQFDFPDQPIVLLLGKEKEGIPVEFLQLVDQCIEIPQLGIIRSLNVHVSGAISIWEFTRQQILAGKLADD